MNKGILYMILSGLCYIIVNVLVKILGQGPDQTIITGLQKYPIPEIILFRSIITFVICFAVIKSKGIPLFGNNKKWLIIRGITGTTALTLYFYTLNNLPIAIAATIQYLSPVFTVLLAIFILKERVKLIQAVFFLVAFIGIVFISFSKYLSQDASISKVNPWWIIVGICSAAFAGIAYNAIAKCRYTDAPVTVVFYFPLIAIPIMAFLTIFDYVIPQGKEWGIILVIGVFTHIAQIFATKSLHSANTATVTPFKYLGSIYAFVLGLFLFDEVISLYAIVGMLLIIVGVLGNTYFRAKAGRKALKT
ncbi:MAG TPA: DMT family transporter [Brumimicrobium sp.]|nr:DMT family transporter [Brumimicrobium sp.]